MSLKELLTKKAELVKRSNEVMTKAKSENRWPDSITDEEAEILESCREEVERLAPQIENAEKREKSLAWAESAARDHRDAAFPSPMIISQDSARSPAPDRPHRPIRHSAMSCFRGKDGLEQAYRFGRWAQAALFGNSAAHRWCESNGIELQATQLEGINNLGGYLVPEEFLTTIVDLREEYGVARRVTSVTPMSSETATFPIKATGLSAYPVGEGESGTQSQLTWRQGLLNARTWQVSTAYSMEVSEDAIVSMADELANDMARAFAFSEDDSLFNGDGSKENYHGILGVKKRITDSGTASIVTAPTGEISFKTLTLGTFENAVGLLPEFAGMQPAWFISKVGWATSMLRLQMASGGTDAAQVAAGGQYQFLGIPVVIVPGTILPTAQTGLTSTFHAYLGDMRLAVKFGSRKDIALASDPYTLMSQRLVRLFGAQRFDINVHSVGSASEVGPIIAIKTAAS